MKRSKHAVSTVFDSYLRHHSLLSQQAIEGAEHRNAPFFAGNSS